MITPRPYQTEAVNAILQAVKRGVRRQLVSLPCGTGKTVTFGLLAKMLNVPTLILAHREELLSQACAKMRLVDPQADVGILQAEEERGLDSRICVASIQTASRPRRLEALKARAYELCIVDECFPPGTLVDGRPIEDIEVGESVSSYNHATGKIEGRVVTKTFTRCAPCLIKLILSDGSSITCTENHPFYVYERGNYIEAGKITPGESVLRLPLLRGPCGRSGQNPTGQPEAGRVCLLHKGVRPEIQRDGLGAKEKRDSDKTASFVSLSLVRGKSGRSDKTSKSNAFISWACVLLHSLRAGLYWLPLVRKDGGDQQKICLGQNEEKQPDAPRGVQEENGGDAKADRAQAKNAQGERKWVDGPTGKTDGSASLFESGCGICATYRDTEGQRIPDELQNRHSASGEKTGYRSGWGQPYGFVQEERRCEKGRDLDIVRVDRVEISKSTDSGESGQGHPVYNLEVEGNNNYFANGILVHNCHHASAESYESTLRELGFLSDDPRRLLVGVTATAYRGDGVALGSIFDEVVYERTIMAMISGGYLTDARGISVTTETDLSGIHTRMGDFVTSELSWALNTPQRNALIAQAYKDNASDRRAVAFCVDVAHSHDLAEAFRSAGVSCEPIWGDMDREARRQTLAKYAEGKIQVLTNCSVLTEGWDDPATSAILLARPTKSPTLYTQMVGRGLRTYPGKADCLVIDFADTVGRHSLCGFATLAGLPMMRHKSGETLSEAVERFDMAEDWKRERMGQVRKEAVDLFERSAFTWTPVAGGHFRLTAGDGRYIWLRNMPEGYSVLLIPTEGEREVLSEAPLPMGYAQGVAEDWVRLHGVGVLVERDAKWRRKPATEKQLELLRKWAVPHDPDTITAGEASGLIDMEMARAQNRREEPASHKQRWFIRVKLGKKDLPEGLTKGQATRIIAQAQREKKGVA